MNPENITVPSALSGDVKSALTATTSLSNRFPQRHNPEEFPDPPSASSSKLPLTMENVRHLLAVSGAHVAYDVIKKRLRFSRDGQPLEECDLIGLANLNGLGHGLFLEFVGTLARRTPHNAVADWITGKPWDGFDRLAEMYATVHLQEGYPESLRDKLLYRWLLSCVAAALKPTGFKNRGVLTFQGPQGAGKTSWVAQLVPEPMRGEWIKLDHHLDAGNKDSILGGIDHWVTEIGELDSSFKKDVARIKGWLTNDCDKIRPPYARSAIEMPRRTVFAATVNDPQFLVDATGNSRWWTIAIEKLDFKHTIDMQQLFAQLKVDFDKGIQWWLTDAEDVALAELNAVHQTTSVIEERIRGRISDRARAMHMTASQVLIEVGVRSPTNPQCKEAGGVLRSIYGPPKRIQGLMKWKVCLRPEDAWDKSELHDEVY